MSLSTNNKQETKLTDQNSTYWMASENNKKILGITAGDMAAEQIGC